jgi:hypothetical protein
MLSERERDREIERSIDREIERSRDREKARERERARARTSERGSAPVAEATTEALMFEDVALARGSFFCSCNLRRMAALSSSLSSIILFHAPRRICELQSMPPSDIINFFFWPCVALGKEKMAAPCIFFQKVRTRTCCCLLSQTRQHTHSPPSDEARTTPHTGTVQRRAHLQIFTRSLSINEKGTYSALQVLSRRPMYRWRRVSLWCLNVYVCSDLRKTAPPENKGL